MNAGFAPVPPFGAAVDIELRCDPWKAPKTRRHCCASARSPVKRRPKRSPDQRSANGINGKPFRLGEKGFSASRNQDLLWRIAEGDDRMLHPVHIHGCQFRIVSQDGRPRAAHRAGWKDTVPIAAKGAGRSSSASRTRPTATRP